MLRKSLFASVLPVSVRSCFGRLLLGAACVAGLVSGARAQSPLQTLFAQNNGLTNNVSVFFDLTINTPVIINQLDVNSSSAAGTAFTLEVYITAAGGTWVGNQNNAGAWTLVGTGNGTAAGVNLPSVCDVSDFQMNNGTHGVCVRVNGMQTQYTNNTPVGTPTVYSRVEMSLASGGAMTTTTPFVGTIINDRIWNGAIHYVNANPNAIGACCLSDGSCQFIMLSSCQSISGSFRGENVTCAAANCPQPGSCCAANGACTAVLQSACTGTSVWSAAATPCNAACPTGACCLPDNSCVVNYRAQCASLSGAHIGDNTACAVGFCNREVEPNSVKAEATPVTLASNGALIGLTTGTTATAGSTIDASIDTFRVKTPVAPLGIYRHTLTLNSSTVGHTGTIRGLNQPTFTAGVWPACGAVGVPGTTDSAVQTTSTATTPPRFNQWYGFGKMEEIYYRVTGVAATTGIYTATLASTQVTPVSIGTFVPGTIAISTVGQGHTTDTDLWVYDSMLNAIDGYGNEDASANGGNPTGNLTTSSYLSRTYAAGTYYLAISNINLSNNKGAPCDDNTRTGLLMDFPDVAVNSSTTTNVNVAFQITDSSMVPVQVLATRAGAYDILWFTFTIADLSGACCASNGTCSVGLASTCTAPNLYQGPASVCNAGACPNTVTACCHTTTGACTFVNGTTCAAGSVANGSVCSPSPCPQLGACCATGGTCSITNFAGCPAPNLFAGLGTTCSGPGNTCPPNSTSACCNVVTGACAFVAGATCPAGATRAGDSCTPSICGQGACCDLSSNACTLTSDAASCATPLLFHGVGSSCAPASACPVRVGQGFESPLVVGTLPPCWTAINAPTTGGATWAVSSLRANTGSQSTGVTYVAVAPDLSTSKFVTLSAVRAAGPLALDFWRFYIVEGTTTCFDSFTVEVSINAGAFTNLRPTPASIDPWITGGYNGAAAATTNPVNGQPAFCFAAPGASWNRSTAVISASADDQVIVRFRVSTDSSVAPAGAGVWIDDLIISNVKPQGTCCDNTTQACTVIYECTCPAGTTANASTSCAPSPCIVSGACCSAATGVCAISTTGQPGCPANSTYQGNSTSCTPNICPQPPSVCCRGATCNTTITQANCTGSGSAGAQFIQPAAACNAAGNNTTPCCYADYNKIGGRNVTDIFAFLTDWFANSRNAVVGGNGDPAGPAPIVTHIFQFLTAWFAGGC